MSASFAGGGVPMILIAMPALAIAFVPSVVVEARILGKRLCLEGRRAVRTSIIANVVSAAIGVPVTWLLLAALEVVSGAGTARAIDTLGRRLTAVFLQAPWLVAGGRESWMVPAAALILLIPFSLVSWRVESAVARALLPEVPRSSISRTMLVANGVTWGALGVVALAVLAARLA